MPTGSKFIHGHTVKFDETAEHGLRQLLELDATAAQFLFDRAKQHGMAEFEDEHARKFALEYHSDYTFNIVVC